MCDDAVNNKQAAHLPHVSSAPLSNAAEKQPRKLAHPRSSELFLPGADWTDNGTVSACANDKCRSAFTLLVGKHHCRWCGRIFCDACAPRTRVRDGRSYRCCSSCTLPVIFRSFVDPFTGQRQSGPLQCIMSYLTPKSITALMQTCNTMLREFPVGQVPYYPTIQSRFPSFFAGAQIGKGAFGIVYKCYDRYKPQNNYVAIKCLVKRCAVNYSMWDKILAEVRILQSAHHPNIAGLIEVFQTTDNLIIVMEAGQGGNLRQAVSYLYAHKLPVEPLVATVLKQISGALSYLYNELGIVHRDVKLDNIVVSEDFTRAMLIDFGLASYVSHGSEPVPFTAGGTPGYASPENIYAAAVDSKASFTATGATMAKADIFSLGVTAFILLSRHRPFRNQRFNKQYLEVEKGIQCTGAGWEHVPAIAASLVARMLSLRAEDRPDNEAIAKDPFIVEFCPQMSRIGEYRQSAREKDAEEQQQEWELLDIPAVGVLADSPDYEQFPPKRISFIDTVYGLVLGRSWW